MKPKKLKKQQYHAAHIAERYRALTNQQVAVSMLRERPGGTR
jgi:hypothetical protein